MQTVGQVTQYVGDKLSSGMSGCSECPVVGLNTNEDRILMSVKDETGVVRHFRMTAVETETAPEMPASTTEESKEGCTEESKEGCTAEAEGAATPSV